MRAARSRRLSGDGVITRPHNVYGASKASAELAARVAAGPVPLTVVRMANVYGAGDRGRVIPLFVDQALRGEPLVLFGGSQILDFISIDHVVRTLSCLGTRSRCKGLLNVGSGTGTTISDLAHRIIRMTGSGSSIRVEPARSFEVDRFVADIGRMVAATGYRPRTVTLDGLAPPPPASTATENVLGARYEMRLATAIPGAHLSRA